jgi:hypothetical protein
MSWYGTIWPGDTGDQVVAMCHDLRRTGYPVPVVDRYEKGSLLWRTVVAAQVDARCSVDGVAGDETRRALSVQPAQPLPEPDTTERGRRYSKLLATLYDDVELRMIPEYRSSDLTAWRALERGEAMDGDDGPQFVVPFSYDGSGKPGATCGHAAWFVTSWNFRAINVELGIFPTWRTGRGPCGEFPKRWLPYLPTEGEQMGGAVHRGLKEHVVAKYRVDDLVDIYRPSTGLSMGTGDLYYLQWDPGHVVTVLVAREGRGFADPRTGLPARLGCYRFAADGSKKTVGQPWTFKRMVNPDPKEWTAWEMEQLGDDGRPTHGPFRDVEDWPLRFEDASIAWGR